MRGGGGFGKLVEVFSTKTCVIDPWDCRNILLDEICRPSKK